jgi:N-acetylglucosamine-6-phosphate deacetylase
MTIARFAIAAKTLFDGRSRLQDHCIVINGDRIEALCPRHQLPLDLPVIERPSDEWLVPGFIDIQVNGGGDVLFNDSPSVASMRTIAAAHRRFGTTSLLPTLITDTADKLRAALAAAREVPAGIGILGLHLEGPFLSPEKPGVHEPTHIRVPTEADIDMLVQACADVTLLTLAPERVPLPFLQTLARRGIRLSLGHSVATYDQTKAALSAGVTGFTHLFNAMRPLQSRDPGPIAAALERADTFFGMIVDGVHVHPAMLRLALRGAGRPMLVTDAMPPVGGRAGTFRLGTRIATRRGSHCQLPDGTLAGTALDMASAVRNAVRLLGCSLDRALSYATLAPAQFLGVDDHVGLLAPGRRADVVALSPTNVRVVGTWLGGVWQQA